MGRVCNPNDILDKRFGMLVVRRILSSSEIPVGKKGIWYECVCDCKNVKYVRRGDLVSHNTQSCGCASRRSRKLFDNGIWVDVDGEDSKRLIENYVGRTFDRLEVIDFDHMYRFPSGRFNIFWKCKCSCKNVCVVSQAALKSGHTRSCGCYEKEVISDVHTIDLSGSRFGFLTVKERVGSKDNYALWRCECDCGNVCNVLSRTLLYEGKFSCGCKSMSKDETIVLDYFKSLGLKYGDDYVYEQKFNDLLGVGGRKLSYDFAVYRDNLLCGLIECQGLQHYQPVSYFGGVESFENQCEHDIRKRNYARQLGVVLLEIPQHSSCSYDVRKLEIESLLSDYLQNIL